MPVLSGQSLLRQTGVSSNLPPRARVSTTLLVRPLLLSLYPFGRYVQAGAGKILIKDNILLRTLSEHLSDQELPRPLLAERLTGDPVNVSISKPNSTMIWRSILLSLSPAL